VIVVDNPAWINIVCVALPFAIGISLIFFRDFWWRIQADLYRARGLLSKRTPSWDITQIILGLLCILLAIILFFSKPV
jgi:hypothetical protein